MKRYWKIITVCFITVIVISAFYIQSSLAAENIVIGFEKVSGDEKELKSLVLNADYVVDNMHQSLYITKNETRNLSNQSIVQQLTRTSSVPAFKQLVEKYGQFMRGKDIFHNSLYEDESLVAYVRILGNGDVSKNTYFNIEILDTKLDETTSMEIDVPNDENYNWVEAVDVQLVDGKLKVIARGFRTESGEDLNVYTIDLDKKVASDETIYSSPKVENGWSDIRVADDNYSVQSKKYLLFQVYAHEMPEYGDAVEANEPNILADEIMIYNIETNQTKKIEVNQEELGFGIDSFSINDSSVFIPKESSNGIEVNQYNIESDSWGEKHIFNIEHDKGEHPPFIKLLNGKIYIVSSANGEYPLFIGDLNTGQSLYEGKLIVKNQKEQKDHRLYIYEIHN